MIGKLSGRLDYRGEDHILLEVRGVGYLVFCSDRTMAGLPRNGEAVALFTDMIVREDLLQLYGFPTLLEKEWHRLLMSVQGIGAKASLAILGTLGAEGVGRAIALGDVNSIKAAKGVGPKTAQRVIIELKDKAPALMAMGGTQAATSGMEEVDVIEPVATSRPVQKGSAAAQSEALSALGNLGYAPAEAAGAVAQASGDLPDAEVTVLIRAALKLLAPKG